MRPAASAIPNLIKIHHDFYLQLLFSCVWKFGLCFLIVRLGIGRHAHLATKTYSNAPVNIMHDGF